MKHEAESCKYKIKCMTKNIFACLYAARYLDGKNDLLGTPDTSLRGLSTLIALKVFRSTISWSVSAARVPESAVSGPAVRMVMYLQLATTDNILAATSQKYV